jgi:hypothetical protein
VDGDERLFAYLEDLEQEAEARFDSERAGELGDRARAEYAAVTLTGRLLASVDRDVALEVRGVGDVTGTLRRVGPDWCLVRRGARDWVVRLDHVVAVAGASERSVPEVARSPVAGLGVGSVLRGLADAGAGCWVHTSDGASYDVVVSRVGADFVEVVTVQGRSLLVALAQVAAVSAGVLPGDPG